MSRSCQSGMPSMTGTIAARTTRASPAIRSDRIGFFLCGIALEPFWPEPNGSDSSRTSVRWPCRTSSAIASQTVAMIASADTHSLIRRAARPGSRRRPAAGPAPSATADLDRRVDQRVRADGAGDGDDADRARAARSRSRDRAAANARSATRCPHTSGSACTPWVRPTLIVVPVRQPVVAQRRDQPVGLGQQDVGGVGQLHRQRGVEQVRRRHAVVHVRGRRAGLGVVRPRGEEGDDVVLRRLLDLGDPLGRRRRRVAHRLDDVGGHPARGGVRLQDERLDPAPQLVLVLVAPDPPHLRERVALDHAGTA